MSNADRIRQAREEFIQRTEDRWKEIIWELSQELGISEEEVERIEEEI